MTPSDKRTARGEVIFLSNGMCFFVPGLCDEPTPPRTDLAPVAYPDAADDAHETARLARALWETEPAVREWISDRSEMSFNVASSLGEDRYTMFERTADIAWERREPAGTREAAEHRAALVMQALSQ